METQNLHKLAKTYVCELCNFTSGNKNNYTLHLSTNKHLANANGDGGDCKPATFNCTLCKKQYNSRNGLWKHAKKCVMPAKVENVIICDSVNIEDPEAIQLHILETSSSNENKILNLVLELMKSNNEMQKQILDVCKNTNNMNNNNINNNNNNNNNNKTFKPSILLE
jgi:hypothetical protein